MNKIIYEAIKQRILLFDYEPGEYLSEKHISSEFGVSRTPVREVFLRLEWEKLVSIIPRAGTMVAKIEFEKLSDVFQTRVPLEGLLGRLVTENIKEYHLAKLEEIRETCEDIFETNSKRTLLDVDMRFRQVLHDVANNDSLKNGSDLLYFQTQRVWHYIFDKMEFGLLVEGEVEYMTHSIAVFRKGDPDIAENYRKKVIYSDLDRVKKIFDLA